MFIGMERREPTAWSLISGIAVLGWVTVIVIRSAVLVLSGDQGHVTADTAVDQTITQPKETIATKARHKRIHLQEFSVG